MYLELHHTRPDDVTNEDVVADKHDLRSTGHDGDAERGSSVTHKGDCKIGGCVIESCFPNSTMWAQAHCAWENTDHYVCHKAFCISHLL